VSVAIEYEDGRPRSPFFDRINNVVIFSKGIPIRTEAEIPARILFLAAAKAWGNISGARESGSILESSCCAMTVMFKQWMVVQSETFGHLDISSEEYWTLGQFYYPPEYSAQGFDLTEFLRGISVPPFPYEPIQAVR
jgi:hypothetical protein